MQRHAIAPHLLLQLSRHLLTPGEEGAWVGASLSQNTSVGRPGGKGRKENRVPDFKVSASLQVCIVSGNHIHAFPSNLTLHATFYVMSFITFL